jgi:hypothetical protein
VFRLLSLLLFLAAAFKAFGWFVSPDVADAVGLIAFGLFFYVASVFDPSPRLGERP